MKLVSLNVCGLRSKALFPEFSSFLNSYDIIGFQETKTDQLDDISLNDFDLYFKHRKDISKYKSGGIALACRKNLSQFVSFIDTQSKLVLWFVISKRLTKTEDILCGVVYIPPESSDYSIINPYQEIENELYTLTDRYSNILLFGDFNSRTKNLIDHIEVDNYICSHLNSDELILEYEKETSYFNDINSCVDLNRISSDKGCNNYGYKLIEFCKCNNVYILNGRAARDKGKGDFTCKNSSTVDYFLCSPKLIPMVNDFCVEEFCQILSDVHCPVFLEMKFDKSGSETCNLNCNKEKIKLWDNDKRDLFVSKFDHNTLDTINERIIQVKSSDDINQTDINNIVDSITNSIITTAEKSFGRTHVSSQNENTSNPPSWFGHRCSKARKQFHTARFRYKLRKNSENKKYLKTASKNYKRTVNMFHSKFQQDNTRKLRKLKNSNPKKYWKILNGKKSSQVKADPESLFNFFKNTNFDENIQGNSNLNSLNDENVNECINGPITESEVNDAIRGLKNNKASGIDLILNEHLKSLSKDIIPTLSNLFNLIFDTGYIPESWTLGMIKPIYKNKGCSKDPSNYRPITLISCLGKLFTAILNNRIQKYADEYEVIDGCQAGFRKGYSTTDNIFILHQLIELACKSKHKLHCAFIDLKQAFDRVWRDGLWEKLMKYHINGKCLRIIQNMYSNIKSCVLVNNCKTDFFISNIGVRQGENLSPFLFSIFLNDLEEFFRSRNATGIECKEHHLDDSLVLYLKIFLLLYADDTVILSNSADGLQNSLNVYDEYCDIWKLTVNQSKSKVIIFSKRSQPNITFTLSGIALETVREYKYLGVLFCSNNSFFSMKKYIAEQGTRAVYSLLSKARNMHLPIDLQIELFDKLVKPILLYGCEVWGFGNVTVIERVQLKFLKHALNIKNSTPNYIVYGEVGVYPLEVEIKARMISYWSKLNSPDKFGTLATHVYYATRSFYNNNIITSRSLYFKWIHSIKTTLNNIGYSGIWDSHSFPNAKWFSKAAKQKLRDLFLVEWYQNIESNVNYRIFKHTFIFESYLTSIPRNLLYYFTSFRTRNHRLPVETGRWANIDIKERKCNLCRTATGDEFHYLLICDKLKESRKEFIKQYYYQRPNIIKYESLINTKSTKMLISLSKFIKVIYETVKQN